MSMAGLGFSCVDFGDRIKLNIQLMRKLGTPGNFEPDQRTALHLAAALEWLGRRKPRRIPNRGRMDSLETEIRLLEIDEEESAGKNLPEQPTLRVAELNSMIRDSNYITTIGISDQ